MKNMLGVWLAAAAAVAMIGGVVRADPPPCNPADTPAPARGLEDKDELEGWLTPVVQCEMEIGHVPGAIVAVVKDGRVVLSKGFGVADIASGRPVSPADSLFRIASVTKTITATAVMLLVERGQLNLDTDVRSVIDFPLRLVSDRPITVAHLLTHRGGFENGLFGVLTEHLERMPPLRDVLQQTMPSQVRPPGTLSAYSNHGFTLLAYAAGRAAGVPFEQYLASNVFGPLGMSHTTFAQPLPPELAGKAVTEYSWTDGRLVPHRFEIVLAAGGGAVSSTADDMARFMLAHLNLGELEGHRILREDTARAMHAVHFAYAPGAGGMGYGFPHMTINGHDVLWHTGALYYSYSRLALIPDAGIGIFVAVNSNWGADLTDNVFLDIVNRYLPAPANALTPVVAPHDLGEYNGYYRPTGEPMTTFAASKSLSDIATVTAGPGVLRIARGGRIEEFAPSGKDRFRPSGKESVLHGDAVFFRDADGAIAGYSPENRATSAMERVRAATRTPKVAAALFGLIAVSMLATLVAVAIASIRSRGASRPDLMFRALLTATALGFFVAVICSRAIAGIISHDSSLVPWQLRVYLTGTTLLAAVTAVTILVVARSIGKGGLGRGAQIVRALWCAVGALEIWMLGYWNLIGFHYY